ncbi:MAG: peptidylprolyl isomerase [Methylococcaceae bacterium]|nr:peptidylprolyl isomerase [Methylococcaceae bacterium]
MNPENPFNLPFLSVLWLAAGLLFAAARSQAMEVNRIVAIVEDGVILESELDRQLNTIKAKLEASGTQLPPESIIRQQVLERMIINKLQLIQAERAGMQVDESTLQRSMAQLAKQNNMSPEQFRNAIKNEGLDYSEFLSEMRNEIIMNQLRNSLITSQIQVSDREIEHFMLTRGKQRTDKNLRYRLGHILIATPEAASPAQIQAAKNRAEAVAAKLKQGADFGELAVSSSDGSQGLSGGDLGWRRLAEIPTIFVDYVPSMQKGESQGPIQSASGFHIIKLMDVEGAGKHVVVQTKVQHILLKTSDLFSDEDAKRKLDALKRRIEDGDDFAALAKAHSDDKASALKGGDLGWVTPGALVPSFEEAMTALPPGELSDPVQTQFGWHLIKVLDRGERDNTEEYRKEQARDEIRKQKIEEETELWLRRLRNEAFVEIRLETG